MSILTNLAVILLVVWLARFLWDVHQLVKKSITAIDRDQHILSQIEGHQPQPDDDDDDGGPQFAIDMDWDEQTAVLEFIDQFRAIRAHYDRRDS